MHRKTSFTLMLFTFLFAVSCGIRSDLKIDYEKYTLENGLEIILHEDRSDPIAAVAVQYHVGSNREEKGRTGFAHLFEHMMFQESQHVPQDQLFKKIEGAGGMINGGTWEDGTIYFEVVPNNGLEMVLWLESDRMGYLLSRVTQDAFINQQNVVQNEKRQVVDNQPYGHTSYVIDKLLYPENHPYNWQVIGEMEDLTNATLKDVHEFHQRWYRPNNATLVIAGDFDVAQTKKWINKYFGEIPSGDPVANLEPQIISLSETKRAFHEDNFANSPELNMVFPTVDQTHDDSYALNLLGSLLMDGKKAPLYNIIVEERKLAPAVSGGNASQEVAGAFSVRVRTFPGVKLSEVEQAIFDSFAKFEEEKFTEEDLERIKASAETAFYNGISSVLGKSFQLAISNEYLGSPDKMTEDLNKSLAVTENDIWYVYDKYIKDKPFILTSFVPRGQVELVAENSTRYPVVEESVSQQAEVTSAAGPDVVVEDLKTSFDRTVEPEKGPDPLLTIPDIWTRQFANGIALYGIEHEELPLVQFSITLRGGMLLDQPEKIGVANLITDMMMEGTARRTPLELEEAIDKLGATISMFTTKESIVLGANCLVSKLPEVYTIVEEILFEPRWDEVEFERIKAQTIETIKRNRANPSSVAGSVFTKLVYGSDHLLANSTLGTERSVTEITIDDLKQYYAKNFSSDLVSIAIVGDISQAKALKTFNNLETKWATKEVTLPELKAPKPLDNAKLYFVDFPNAMQSQIRIGYIGLPYAHPDFYKTQVMNYKLGGGANGVFFMILREEKGFTYGAYSNFSGTHYPGTFMAYAGVRSTATRESVSIFKEEMEKYRDGIAEEDLQFTKNALVKSNALRFETLGALMGMLNEIAAYDLPFDYVKQQEDIVRTMTVDEHKKLAQNYIEPSKMVYLVVGDARTQLRQLSRLGLGRPQLLDVDGNPAR